MQHEQLKQRRTHAPGLDRQHAAHLRARTRPLADVRNLRPADLRQVGVARGRRRRAWLMQARRVLRAARELRTTAPSTMKKMRGTLRTPYSRATSL